MKLYDAAVCVCQALLFPQSCVLCGAWVNNPDLSPVCRPCLSSLPKHSGPMCRYCGICLPATLAEAFAVCSACRQQRYLFDRARSVGPYQGALRELIHKYKFEGFRRLAKPLAAMLEGVIAGDPDFPAADWILPAPLHPTRRRERGFDQTLQLASSLSASLRIPVFSGLRRIRPTAPQFGLDHDERARNVRGAFALSGGQLSDRTILVVDDVMTTGATINEICRLLREQASPKQIVALTLARVSLTKS